MIQIVLSSNAYLRLREELPELLDRYNIYDNSLFDQLDDSEQRTQVIIGFLSSYLYNAYTTANSELTPKLLQTELKTNAVLPLGQIFQKQYEDIIKDYLKNL